MSKNQLSGEIPDSIGKLEQLIELFKENNLTGLIPSSLDGCKQLTTLHISSNSFYLDIPWELFSIYTLSVSLDLSNNKLTTGDWWIDRSEFT